MSYTPTTWQTGDIITAAKLNNMEQGIAGNNLVFIESEIVDNNGVLSLILKANFNELSELLSNGKILYTIVIDDTNPEYYISYEIIYVQNVIYIAEVNPPYQLNFTNVFYSSIDGLSALQATDYFEAILP